MQSINIEIADNGIIKTIVDDNINGAGERFETKTVYDLERHNVVDTKIEILYELSEDMGIDLGNAKQVDQIKIISEWGESYEPSKTELEEQIKDLEHNLESLKILLKDIK
tara:strand:+ start:5255 stop:5584 length:330 start_codon:yes stop_codon:yes gene_type:complete